jgi:hypothetical protein
VRAGLLPALRNGALEGSKNWLFALFSPRTCPLDQLQFALTRLSPETAALYRRANAPLPTAQAQQEPAQDEGPADDQGQDEYSALHQQIDLLVEHLELLLADDPHRKCVIVVDQFEELFTQTNDDVQRLAFIQLLTGLADSVDGRTPVILTLRSDFVSPCAVYPRLRALINQQFHLVGAMEPEELLRAIVQPLLKVGAQIEPALVSTMITDMRGEPGTLPLMQFALDELFAPATRQKGHEVSLTLDDYTQKGGIYGILERQADAVLARLTPDQLLIARHIFSCVVEVGRDAPDARRIVSFAELVPANASAGAVAAVLETLSAAEARLIIAGIPDASDGQSAAPDQYAARWQNVTLAHEKLIVAWPWLARLVNEQREWRLHQQRIDEERRAWQQSQNANDLLRGQQLASAAIWAKKNPLWVTQEQRAFLEASHKHEIRSKWTRRGWQMFVLLLVVPGLFFGLNVWMFVRLKQSHWQPIQGFPSHVVTAATVANAAAGRTRAQGALPQVCVGTNHIGVGCTEDGVSWNLYQSGLPTGAPDWLASRETLWGMLTGDVWSGRVRAVYDIQFDRADHASIYVFLRDDGLYRSSNGGGAWSPVKIHAAPGTFPTVGASKIEVDGRYLWVASGWDNEESSNGLLFVSSDGGASWQTIERRQPPTGFVNDFWLSAGQPAPALYFVSSTGLFYASQEHGWTPERMAARPEEGEWIWISQDEASGDFYLVGYDADQFRSTLHRWSAEDHSLQQLGGRRGPVEALAVNPGERVAGLVWLLFENGEIVVVDAQGVFTSYGARPGWPWTHAYSIWFAPAAHDIGGGYTPNIGHSDGILQCESCMRQPP